MKPKFRILLIALVTSIAIVVGIFVVKQVQMCCPPEHFILAFSPTEQTLQSITLSPGDDYVSQDNETHTSISATGTKLAFLLSLETTETRTASPTLGVDTTKRLTPIYEPCAWSWAHRDLPDTARAVQEALVSAGMTNVQIIRADAYGEECGNLPHSAHNFGAMSTDFYLSATVSNPDDVDEKAKIILDVYKVLSSLKIELPAHPGYLEITFTSGGETKHFRAGFEAVKQAIEAGKSAKELVALGEW